MPVDECNKDAAAGPLAESFLTVKQVADLLHLHEQTVRDDIRRGNLEVTRLGPRRTRVSTSQYVAYVEWLKDPANWS
jgi:excisionase family DNA binding protein